jgi:hypothetical protein
MLDSVRLAIVLYPTIWPFKKISEKFNHLFGRPPLKTPKPNTFTADVSSPAFADTVATSICYG